MGIPLHLAVHVVGLTVTAGLAGFAWTERERATPAWPALLLGSGMLLLAHLASGLLVETGSGWPVYARAVGYAAIAVGAAGRLRGITRADAFAGAFAPLAVAVTVGPPEVHLATALAGTAAAVAAWRGVLARGREVALLVGGLLAWAASDAVLRDTPTIAGLLSLVGSGAAAAWLLRRARAALATRLLAAFAAVLVVLVLAMAAAAGVFAVDDLRDGELSRLQALASARAADVVDDAPLEVRRAVAPYATSTTLQADLAALDGGSDGDALDRRAATVLQVSPTADVALLVGLDGRVGGTWDATAAPPGPLGPTAEAGLAGSPPIGAALGGTTASGLVTLGDRGLYALAATPVAPADDEGRPQLDRPAGVVALARRLDDDRLVGDVADATGSDAVLLLGGEVAASTLGADADAELVAALDRAGSTVVQIREQDRFVASAPLLADDGRVLGVLALVDDATAFAAIERDTTRSLFGVAVVALLVAGAAALWLARRLASPVVELTVAAERVAAGDDDVAVTGGGDDEVGRLAGAFSTMVDAVALREDRLREAAVVEAELRGRLQAVTDAMGEAILAVGADGRVLLANPAARRLLGDGVVTGVAAADVVDGFTLDGDPLLETLLADDTLGVRGVVTRPDGGELPVAASSASLAAGEDRVGRVLLLADATREAEVERMKSTFIANISHELRTPLVPVKGYAAILHSRELDRERQVEFSGTILSGVERLERIIGMLVDYAALEAGRLEVALEATDLRAWLTDELPGLMPTPPPGKETRELHRRVARDLPLVHVDRALLSRVARELLDNAVKFSDGPVEVLARRRGDVVELAVRDRGIGMDDEALARVTRDFEQGDASATRRHGGLGLGLAIVQRILDRFGGALDLRSTPGEGTTAIVRLPVVAP